MKITISAGWGYGNIGDDIILMSQIKLLNKLFDGAKITILTYCLEDSKAHLKYNENIELKLCLHRYLDLGISRKKYPKPNEFSGFLTKVHVKIIEWFLSYPLVLKAISLVKKSEINTLKYEIESSDLFIMCGGGYFNENWSSKINAQLEELKIAKNASIPYMILGPTIGNISDKLSSKVYNVFEAAKIISVRDEASKNELNKLDLNSSIIPDVALSCWLEKKDDDNHNSIGIVFNNNKDELKNTMAETISGINEKLGGFKVKLFITRKWLHDVKNALKLQEILVEYGVDTILIYPSCHKSLEQELSKCRIVISENLHGLITAARNLVPVIAINDYAVGSPNHKKFVGFLKQAGCENLFFNQKTSQDELFKMIESVLLSERELKKNLKELRESCLGKYKEVIMGALDKF